MRRVLADAVCWIALLNPKDQAHECAVGVLALPAQPGQATAE